MKKYAKLVLLLMMLLGACSKEKSSEIKANLILDYMSAGLWELDLFTILTGNVLPEYNGYTFQFKRNGTVSAIKDSTMVTGTWYGDQDKRSVTAEFPKGSGPLLRLNAKWYLVKLSDSIAVEAIDLTSLSSIRLVRKK